MFANVWIVRKYIDGVDIKNRYTDITWYNIGKIKTTLIIQKIYCCPKLIIVIILFTAFVQEYRTKTRKLQKSI